jgi:opacity protein-like surface antigen
MLCIVLFMNQIGYSQIEKVDVSRAYNRNSISFIIISHPNDQYNDWTLNSFKQNDIGGKYNLNPLSNNTYEAPFSRDGNESTETKAAIIEKYLNENKYAKEIIEHWFNRQPDGSMDMSTVFMRGRYNASEGDYKIAMMTKRGESILYDEGSELINKSYIVVFDVRNINKTMYESTAKLAWEGTADAYLFKVEFDENAEEQVYKSWFESNDKLTEAEKKAKQKEFDQINFSVKQVFTICPFIKQNTSSMMLNTFLDSYYQGNTNYQKPSYVGTGEAEYSEFISDMYQQSMDAIESIRPDFKVKTTIVSDWPIRAKIGKKEGLRRKQNYGVYEARLDTINNEVYAQEIATIMTTQIGKNQFNANSKNMSEKRSMTKFAMLSEKGNIEPGMFIEAQPGLSNLSLYHDIIVGPDIVMSSLFGLRSLNFMTTSSFSGSLLYDVWMASNKVPSGDYYDEKKDNFSFGLRLGYSLGVNLFYPNIKLEPFGTFGYGYSSTNQSTSDQSSESESKSAWNEVIVSYGGNIVFNINYPMQLYIKAENVLTASAAEFQPGFGLGLRYTPGARKLKKAYHPARINLRNGAIVHETNEEKTATEKTRKEFEREDILLGGIALHPSQKSVFIMVGRVKRVGEYFKIKSNLRFNGSNDIEGESSNNIYFNDNTKKGRFAITGGLLWRISSPTVLYSGIGYGSRWVNWETISGESYRVTDISYKGLELEAGLIYKVKKLQISGGLSTTSLKSLETNIGIGVKF